MLASGITKHGYVLLKSKESRLRDWNETTLYRCVDNQSTWNQKNLDYEIETTTQPAMHAAFQDPWNQKNLDYEIETWCQFSDTKKPNTFTWNQKNLDYEIETSARTYCYLLAVLELEIKRISITRLKQTFSNAYLVPSHLEIKRISITRLKRRGICGASIPLSYLEIKRISITRLKRDVDQR